ncbi:hypothetical protein L916_01348 [Phytophthora nicotianae]|uniref:Uncharacterized protein n=1 Tax=Phytophthora nicotianae TaxID=4792 RepID=W2JU10_PHYNI|nr:hypothetical protein L916_01348 [Phytophthora nicotianae]
MFASTFHKPHERRCVPADVREDLVWFRAVLTVEHQFNSIPVEHFARLQPPTYHVMMDASDTGIRALEPKLHQYIRLQLYVMVSPPQRKTTRSSACRRPYTNFSPLRLRFYVYYIDKSI